MFKQERRRYQQKWKKDPNETCPKDEHGNNRNISCFVPSCVNKMWSDGQKNRRLVFFKVPDGTYGLKWTKEIRKIGKKKYKDLLKLVKKPGGSLTNSYNSQYCCEAHFDVSRNNLILFFIRFSPTYVLLQIRQDIRRVVHDDGSVEFIIKSGVLPSRQRRQKERLVHIFNSTAQNLVDDCEMVISNLFFHSAVDLTLCSCYFSKN